MFLRAYPRGVRGALRRLLESDAQRVARPLHKWFDWPELEEIDDSAARLTGRPFGRLDQVLEHPELFRREPRLRRVRVRQYRGDDPDVAGSANPFPGFRSIDLTPQIEAERLSTILHEAQHAADSLGRVSRSDFLRKAPYWERPGEVRARLVQARRGLSPAERQDRAPFADLDIRQEDIGPSSNLHPEDFAYPVYGILGAGWGGSAYTAYDLLRQALAQRVRER